MESFDAIVKQIPQLAALIWLVYQFIGYIKARDNQQSDQYNKISCILEKNNEVLGKLSEIISNNTETIDNFEEHKKCQ